MINTERQTYRLPEAANIIGISESLLSKKVRTGEFPALRIGRRVIITQKQLNAILDGINKKEGGGI